MTMTGTELSLMTMMMMTILVPPLLLCDKPKTNFEFLFQSVLMTKCDDYIADGGNGSNDHLSNAIADNLQREDETGRLLHVDAEDGQSVNI